MNLPFPDFDLIPPNVVVFFEPTDDFLDWLVEYVGDQFVIEVGAGKCEFTRAMHKLGIKAMAIEPRACSEVLKQCGNFLLPLSVQQAGIFLSDKLSIVIAARPDHSGWFAEVPELIHEDSELLYIGLEKKLDIDIPDWCVTEKMFEGAGRDGECVWRVTVG